MEWARKITTEEGVTYYLADPLGIEYDQDSGTVVLVSFGEADGHAEAESADSFPVTVLRAV